MRVITACHHRHGPKLSSLHLSQASTSGLCFTLHNQYVAFAPAVLAMCTYMSQYDMNYSIYISHDPLPVQAVSLIQFGLRTNCLHQMFAVFGHTSFSQIGVITIVLLFLHQSVARVILDDSCGQFRPWNFYISASSHYVRDLCLNEFSTSLQTDTLLVARKNYSSCFPKASMHKIVLPYNIYILMTYSHSKTQLLILSNFILKTMLLNPK